MVDVQKEPVAMSHYIARFNPYSMDDETVLAVATGRQPAHGCSID